ncbi:MAG: hypothetical protein IJT51_09110 [Bacteroidales bacterium]|nr:hypothetical protein [Bacteroidales bacterium]
MKIALTNCFNSTLVPAARYNKSQNAKYDCYLIGNFIQAKKLGGNEVGLGSQYSMIIDFNKMFAGIADGSVDGQTAIHELFHNIGAKDSGVYGGTNIMNWNLQTESRGLKGNRVVNIKDVEQIVNNPFYPHKIAIVYE